MRMTGLLVAMLLEIAALLWGARCVRAEVLARESFDYPAGASLAGASGGSGWGGPWQVASGDARLQPNPATVDGVPCYDCGVVLAGNSRASRLLDVAPGGAFDRAGLVQQGRIGRDGTTVYVGLLQRVSVVPATGGGDAAYLRFYSFEFNTGPGDDTRVLEIGHDDRSNPPHGPFYGAASVRNGGGHDREPGQFRSLGVQDTATNLIVVKFTFGTGDQDTAEVFRNPQSPTAEPAPVADATLRGDFAFDRLALARFVGNEPVHQVDEIRVGTRWADVLPTVDRQHVQQVVEQALRELQKQVATRQRQLDQLAAAGHDVSEWRRRLQRVSAGSHAGPWQRLRELEDLAAAMQLAERGLDVPAVLFVHRHMYQPSHIYTEYSDGPFRGGGGVCLLSPARPDGQRKLLFDARGGICRDPELSFDARRVLFSYRPAAEGYYHIYEMSLDGSDLRQLTEGPYHDLDPLYLADGRIAFTSTRCHSRVLCFWSPAATLCVMDADGSNIRRLTYNNVNEFTPDVLPDGRILYTRWEYLDKSAIFVQSLWATAPDGTRAQQVFGNNLIHPVSLLQARLIPGTNRLLCTLAAHNGDSTGPLAIVSPDRGLNNPEAILNLTPECNYHSGCCAPYPLNDQWCLVSYGPREPFGLYAFQIAPPPSAIRPARVQVALQSPQDPSNLGEYWPSARGERLLLYRDEKYSCVEPIPVRPRPTPPVMGSALGSPRLSMEATTEEGSGVVFGQTGHDLVKRTTENNSRPPGVSLAAQGSTASAADEQPAVLAVADVYRGLEDAVPRGRVKYLRVVAELGHREYPCRSTLANFMQFYAAPWESNRPAPSLQAKYVYGTVPVEPDGSAYFLVPPERPIYLQALDDQHNEIQRMRSYIHLQPGERQSCIGCHDHRQTTPPVQLGPRAALARAPSPIEPPPWGAGPFSYQALVQPVWEHRCVSCHGTRTPAGGVDLSGTRDGRHVPASFSALVRPRSNPARPPLVNFFDSWWGVSTTVPVAQPLSFGAAVSRLMEVIDTQHAGVALSVEQRAQLRLSPVERQAVTTWIDLNCPLWEDYAPEQHAIR